MDCEEGGKRTVISRDESQSNTPRKRQVYRLLSALLLLLVLWATPVYQFHNHRPDLRLAYQVHGKTFVLASEDYWDWQTNLLFFSFSCLTRILFGGYAGPTFKTEKVLYRIGCSPPEVVLRAPGSTFDMIINQGDLYAVNNYQPENVSTSLDFSKPPQVYRWDGHRFVAVGSKKSSREWQSEANRVYLGKVSPNDRMTFTVCGKKAVMEENHSLRSITWTYEGHTQLLLKPKPDELGFGRRK